MKLNLGCGKDIREGYVNLDRLKIPGVDVIHDINILPLPFKDNEFDEILAKDVVEHVDYQPLMKELHRILKPGGKLIIMAPHFCSTNMYSDPQHRNFFAIRTLSFFAKNNPNFDWSKKPYYYDFAFSSIKAKITFPRHFPWDRITEKLVNMHPKLQMLYELSVWRAISPAENIEAVLVK